MGSELSATDVLRDSSTLISSPVDLDQTFTG